MNEHGLASFSPAVLPAAPSETERYTNERYTNS